MRRALWLSLWVLSECAMAASSGEPPRVAEPSVLRLSQAWRLALQNDPGYLAALSERDAGQANRAIGRAGLLPQVNAYVGRTKVHGTLETPGACGTACTDLDYISRINEIRATQTVFNWSRIAEYRQGHARADYSLAVFDTRAEDSSIRLVNRYFQALLTDENRRLMQSKLQANEKQVNIAQRRYEAGEGIIPDVREALSRRDLARADVIQSDDAYIVAMRELQEMIGYAPARLVPLARDFKPQPLTPASIQEWLALAVTGSPEIRAAQENLRVADHEIDRVFGGHLPSLELVVARRNVDAETISTRDQSSNTTAVGIELAVPIYSGGLVSAQVDQARHTHAGLAQELAATRERIEVEVTRQYQAVVTGARRIEALVQAVASSDEAFKATETGYRLGTRSISDVLDAEDRVYQSRLDLTRARLEYTLAHLSLSAAAGRLDAALIERIDEACFDPENARQAVAAIGRDARR